MILKHPRWSYDHPEIHLAVHFGWLVPSPCDRVKSFSFTALISSFVKAAQSIGFSCPFSPLDGLAFCFNNDLVSHIEMLELKVPLSSNCPGWVYTSIPFKTQSRCLRLTFVQLDPISRSDFQDLNFVQSSDSYHSLR
jgi:hypothetical protein